MSTAVLTVDVGAPAGRIRPLHGGNLGPLTMNGMHDFSEYLRELAVPVIRMHDCPYAVMDTADIHYIFPDFAAPADDPAAYRFDRTDAYVQSIVDLGAKIVYRLGESIEHYRVQTFNRPPTDFEKWADVCLHVIRHYNEGWADGFGHGIEYWEIWNEPNGPPCWSGSAAEYLRLYALTSKKLKAAFPHLRIGSLALAGDEPYWGVRHEYLRYCAEQRCPLDFFAFHCYTDSPAELVRRARHCRELLDRHGYGDAELHLNEWNLKPLDQWTSLLGGDPAQRERHWAQLRGCTGAAFIASTLLLLQDTPIDVANFYWLREGWWGLWSEQGVRYKSYYAFKAFRRLLDFPHRLSAHGGDMASGLAVCAGMAADERSVAVMVSNYQSPAASFELRLANLPRHGAWRCVQYRVDEQHDFEAASDATIDATSPLIRVDVPAPGVALLELSPLDR